MLLKNKQAELTIRSLIPKTKQNKLALIFIIIGVIAGFCVANPTQITIGIPATMLFILLIFFIAPLFSKDLKEKKLFVNLALTAFLLRTVVVFILVSVALYVFKDHVGGYSFANDAYRYLNSANSIIEYFEQGGDPFFLFTSNANWKSVSNISNYFPWVSFFITVIFGSIKTLVAGSLFSAFMASLTVVVVYKIAVEILPQDKQHRAIDVAVLLIIYPSFIIFTSVMLKEATIVFLTYALIYVFYKYIHNKKASYLLLFFVGLLVLSSFRFYCAGVLMFALGLGYFFYSFDIRNPSQVIKTVIVLIILLPIILIFGKSLFRIDFILGLLDVENMAYIREAHYGSASTYFELGDLSSPMAILKALPLGMMYMLLSPFPWQWFMGSDIIEKALAPDMVLYYILFPSAIIGFIKIIKEKPLLGLILIMYYLALIVPYSILIGNFGTIYRLRIQLLPCFFTFAVIGGTPLIQWIYFCFKYAYENITKLKAPKSVFDF